ncbi:ribosome maturation factor RimP [Marinicella rhabdoformis]|uniref:ribosome maturation factor RimP n=1 Tax=Marinicella rhabdoformis TaxID=2580566 RepID=UPI0012AEC8CB|nr:ribosome maturation factor RimP [Marinicella rhabdoformis]
MKEKLLSQLIAPIVEDLGFAFWGLEYLPQKNGAMLRVFIDAENGVGVNDCAKCSREISGVLEVEDPISSAYILEVSSPGMDRVLFSAKQIADYMGQPVQVKLAQAVDGARNIKGNITAVDGELITVSNEQKDYQFEFDNVMKARLKPVFDGVKK